MDDPSTADSYLRAKRRSRLLFRLVGGATVLTWAAAWLAERAGDPDIAFSRAGFSFAAISAEVTVEGWTVDSILAGPRLRTRSRYAACAARLLLDASFELLPTFAAPHYSIVLEPYTPWRLESCSSCSAKSTKTRTS